MKGIGNTLAPARFLLFAVLCWCRAWRRASRYLAGATASSPVSISPRRPFSSRSVPLFGNHGADAMRARSAANDANRTLLLVITGAVMLAILIAVAVELSGRDANRPHVALLIASPRCSSPGSSPTRSMRSTMRTSSICRMAETMPAASIFPIARSRITGISPISPSRWA